MTATRLVRSALACGIIVIAGCAGDSSSRAEGEWLSRIDTIGDTITVRTVSGSELGPATLVPELRIGALAGADHEQFGQITGIAVDARGRIYVYDSQVPALRSYAPDGSFLRTLGRDGGGPGEYRQSDGGLAVLGDGRIVLRDPGNGRFIVFGTDGEFLESWPGPQGMFTSTPMVSGTDGGYYNPEFSGGRSGLVRYSSRGAPLDTLFAPPPVATPMLTARAESASQTWSVPFSPSRLSRLHRDGYFLSAISDRYAIDVHRPGDAVLRIARDMLPVRVTPAERTAEEERVRRAMRGLDPAWQWDGPPIPQTKPLLRALFPAGDGRIWVQVHQPGEPVPPEELQPERDGRLPPRFREPTVFDVFELDGRYLGRVSAPTEFSPSPAPVFSTDHVWAVERDQLGVQYVVRYRIVHEDE